MDVLKRPIGGGLKRYWWRRKYQHLHGGASERKRLQVTRLGGGIGSPRRSWRIKIIPKLRWKMIASPLRMLIKLKNAYINMMMNLAGSVGFLNTNNTFGGKRIPKAREVSAKYSQEEFENRLIIEIYKSLKASQVLGPR